MRKDTYKIYRPQTPQKETTPSNEISHNNISRRRSTFLHPKGDPKTAKYIIIAEQPITHDVIKGQAFSSSYATDVNNLLRAAEISPADCYFTYLIKDLDRPSGFYFNPIFRQKTIIDYKITEEGQEYLDILKEELNSCFSSTIIAFGNLTLFCLLDRISQYKWRSSILESTLVPDKTVIPTLEPSTINYPQNQFKNKRLIIFDMRRAKLVEEGKWKKKVRSLIIKPSFFECLNYLQTCIYYGKLGNPISFDIEMDVFNHEMTCISLSYSPTSAISIPFVGSQGDYFTLEQEVKVMRLIARILEDPDICICGQNLSFDCQHLLHKYGIKSVNVEDTLIAQKTLLPDYSVGLDFICSSYTDIPYYKDDGKYWLKGVGSFEQGWRYNALDSIVCSEALPKQLEALKKQRNYYTYKRKTLSLFPYIYIMEHGIKININTMQAHYRQLRRQADETLLKLEKLAGKPLNPNSPKQIASYFYDEKGLPPYKSKSGGRSTDETAMKRISRKGFKEAKLILKRRNLIKLSSTYLTLDKVDDDERIRCSYNPSGTRFSRASSSKSIYGKGNNLQNQPHSILTHFTADESYVFYGQDLGQAENRIVAYAGRISQMISAFENNIDIHSRTAKIMIAIYYGPEKAKHIGVKDKAPLGDGTQTWRQWGKKANHGFNYDWSYKAFALKNEISERDGKTVYSIYHKAYPGVKNGFHSYVRKCINQSRTITNYMGRKTFFADAINDNLYREAYSCIPQGTVGDIIDQRGLNFIYYNTSPIFKPVELLIQIHDQIGYQIPTPYHPSCPVPWEAHVEVLQAVKKSLETPIKTHYGLPFSIPVDTTMGISLNKDLGRALESLDTKTLDACYEELFYDKKVQDYYFLKENT